MTDTVIKGTGNSRTLKSVSNFLTLYPSYEDFARAIIAGTLPIDLGPLQSAGYSTKGTDLNKTNLLKDATAFLYGKTASAVPDDIFAAIRPLITTAQTTADAAQNELSAKCTFESGTRKGNGNYSGTLTLNFSFQPKVVHYWRISTMYVPVMLVAAYGTTETTILGSDSRSPTTLEWGQKSLTITLNNSNSAAFDHFTDSFGYAAFG